MHPTIKDSHAAMVRYARAHLTPVQVARLGEGHMDFAELQTLCEAHYVGVRGGTVADCKIRNALLTDAQYLRLREITVMPHDLAQDNEWTTYEGPGETRSVWVLTSHGFGAEFSLDDDRSV